MTHDPTPARSRDLEAMLAGRPDRDALREVWETLPRVAPPSLDPSPDARRAAWNRLRATIADPSRTPFTTDVPAPLTLMDDEQPAATPAPRATVRRSQRWLVAASAAGVLIAGGAALRAVPTTYSAPATAGAAPVVAVRLADGSNVWLAAGSTLSVPRALGWPGVLRASSRDVVLSGRGFFAVQKDGRPFVVRTTDAAVRVLGTRFEVLSATAAGSPVVGTQVTVQEGRVAVTAASRDGAVAAAVELGAGQRAATMAGRAQLLPVRSVSAEQVGAWRTGGFSALDESLDAVLSELARRSALEITHAREVDGAVTVSLFYPDMPSVDTVLNDLCTAQGLTLTRTSRGFHITRGGSLQ